MHSLYVIQTMNNLAAKKAAQNKRKKGAKKK